MRRRVNSRAALELAAAGATQHELALQLGVSTASVSRILGGRRPSPPTFERELTRLVGAENAREIAHRVMLDRDRAMMGGSRGY